MWPKIRRFYLVVVFFLTLLLCFSLFFIYERYQLAQQRQRASEAVDRTARLIQNQIVQNVSAAKILAILVAHHKGHVYRFNSLAKKIIAQYPTITTLELAPKGVISNIYPLKGNEKALGLDLLLGKTASDLAKAAVKTKGLTVEGPFSLKQGGQAFIGRMPVFLGENGQDFWGLAIVLTRLNTFVDSLDLSLLEKEGYSYAIWHINPNDRQKKVFARSNSPLSDQAILTTIPLPGNTWYIGLSPRGGWGNRTRSEFEVILSLLFSLGAGYLTYRFQHSNAKLRESLAFSEDIIYHSPTAKVVYHASGPCVIANEALARMVGGTQEQLLQQNFRTIKSFRETGLYQDCLAALDDGQLKTREFRTQTSYGKKVWVKCQIMPTLLNGESHLVLQFLDLTELKLSSQALQSARDRLKTLLDLASDGIHILDDQGNLVEFSQSFANMLGYTAEEAASLNVADWDMSGPKEKLIKGVRRRIGQSAYEIFESRHRCKKGAVIDVEISCRGIELEGQKLLYASSRNISERKVAEQALRSSEERFKRLVDAMPEAIIEVDEEGVIVAANARTRALFGFELDIIWI
jgi:PAS domain S-box-containing protein